MLLRNCWYIAAWVDEIGDEQPLMGRVCNEPIVVFRCCPGAHAAAGPVDNQFEAAASMVERVRQRWPRRYCL
jgi:phenylpropionate dioxygenase-like ring-hydroxylating dioxygenase large terminal subunit